LAIHPGAAAEFSFGADVVLAVDGAVDDCSASAGLSSPRGAAEVFRINVLFLRAGCGTQPPLPPTRRPYGAPRVGAHVVLGLLCSDCS
jgi:hypothetical protein